MLFSLCFGLVKNMSFSPPLRPHSILSLLAAKHTFPPLARLHNQHHRVALITAVMLVPVSCCCAHVIITKRVLKDQKHPPSHTTVIFTRALQGHARTFRARHPVQSMPRSTLYTIVALPRPPAAGVAHGIRCNNNRCVFLLVIV